jgi:hypothetical protein
MRPSELVQMKKDMAAVVLTLRGDFESEIAALSAKIAEWDQRNNLDSLTQTLAKGQSDLDAMKVSLQQEVQTQEDLLNARLVTVQEYENKIKVREADVEQGEQDLVTAKAQMQATLADAQANNTILSSTLSAKMDAVDKQLADLSLREADVSMREAKVRAALAKVGELVA